MELIKDGRFVIPLFHGTSTLFLDDIVKGGLGAVSPIKKYHIMETLDQLVQIGFEYREHLPSMAYLNEGKMIVNQTGFNYKYDGVYLTPSIFAAARYSLKRYGSELITKTINLYQLLKQHSVPVELNNDFLNQIKNNYYEPLVIMASDVQVSWLQSERRDNTMEDQLRQLHELVEIFDNEIDIATQQTNFELPYPRTISPENLSVITGDEFKKIRKKYHI